MTTIIEINNGSLEYSPVLTPLKLQIDKYIQEFIQEEYLHNGEYPTWKDDIIGNDPDECVVKIINDTLNGELYRYLDETRDFFELPSVRNAHGDLIRYIITCQEEVEITFQEWLVDGDRACWVASYFWLNNNRDYLKQKLVEFREWTLSGDEDE